MEPPHDGLGIDADVAGAHAHMVAVEVERNHPALGRTVLEAEEAGAA